MPQFSMQPEKQLAYVEVRGRARVSTSWNYYVASLCHHVRDGLTNVSVSTRIPRCGSQGPINLALTR